MPTNLLNNFKCTTNEVHNHPLFLDGTPCSFGRGLFFRYSLYMLFHFSCILFYSSYMLYNAYLSLNVRIPFYYIPLPCYYSGPSFFSYLQFQPRFIIWPGQTKPPYLAMVLLHSTISLNSSLCLAILIPLHFCVHLILLKVYINIIEYTPLLISRNLYG